MGLIIARIRSLRGPALARLFESLEIPGPVPLAVPAQLVQYRPGVEARSVPIVEDDPDRVAADRLDPGDADVLLAHDEDALAGRMPLHLGRRRVDPEILGVEVGLEAVVEAHDEPARLLFQRDLDGLGHFRSM